MASYTEGKRSYETLVSLWNLKLARYVNIAGLVHVHKLLLLKPLLLSVFYDKR